MAELNLAAQPRLLTGRKVRQLRVQGLIPAVVYGKKQKEAESLQVSARSFERVLHSAGFSQLVTIDVEGGKTHNVLIRDIHRHPVTHHPIHVDFYAVDLTEKQQISIPVQATGKATALVTGFMVLQSMEQVTVEALPSDLPTGIEVDITNLTTDTPVTVADLPVIAGVTYVNEPDEAIFTMIATRGGAESEAMDAELASSAEPELVTADDEDDEAA